MGWLHNYGWEAIPPEALPFGKVAFHRDTACAAGFIYFDPLAKIAFLTLLMVDPDASEIRRAICLKKAISELVEEAKTRFGEKGIIYEVTANRSVCKLLEKMGFRRGERSMTSMVYSFGGLSTDFLKEE